MLSLSGIQEINFESTNQATDVINKIMLLYNDINISLRKKTYKPILYISTGTRKNDEQLWQEIVENIKLWARGYWIGIEATWPFKENMEFNPDIHSRLGMIYYLNLSKQEFIEECKELNLAEENYYQLFIDCLPNAVIEMYDFWLDNHREKYSRKIASSVTNDFKVRRNDPCRCGSGKKYEKCCLH